MSNSTTSFRITQDTSWRNYSLALVLAWWHFMEQWTNEQELHSGNHSVCGPGMTFDSAMDQVLQEYAGAWEELATR